MVEFRKDLSAPSLTLSIKDGFCRIRDHRQHGNTEIPLASALMSGLACFSLKSPSLLFFDNKRKEGPVAQNLKNLFHVTDCPSDTQLREIVDEVDTTELQPAYQRVFSTVQRGGALAGFQFMGGKYLVPIDGTGYFSSHEIHCENCRTKEHRDGSITYHHQMLSAIIAHPEKKVVLPFIAPEPIIKQDGQTKNDCERNAAKRLLLRLRRDHPHLKIIVVEDGLASNAPHIRLLKDLNMDFILGAQPGDHESLFNRVAIEQRLGTVTQIEIQEGALSHRFRFINQICLNESNPDLFVNFIEYWEVRGGEEVHHFSWVTNIEITQSNAMIIMRGGRARWRIENETFNTLKNQGYEFEHNFGHGYKNLSVNFALLMMLAFFIDQVLELCCSAFQAARKAQHSKRELWETMRSLIRFVVFKNWETFLQSLIKLPLFQLNTS